jgi:hypothetical protein
LEALLLPKYASSTSFSFSVLTSHVLVQPIKDVLNCLIGIKVKGIQKGLTWAHENAHITFPTLPNNTFSLGAAASISKDAKGSSSFLSDTSSKAADGITDVVIKLTTKWESMIREEAILSSSIVAIWLVVLLIAFIRTMVLFWTHDKQRGETGGGMPSPTHPIRNLNIPPTRSSPVFPTFGASSSSPAGSEEKVDIEDGHWVQTGSVDSKTNVESGDYRRSVYPSYGGGSRTYA